jgi:hypothetical protein
MRNLVTVLLVSVLIVCFSAHANANGHHKRHLRVLESRYQTTYWRYQTSWRGSGPPSYAAYQPILAYGPGNRRCVSTLEQLQNGSVATGQTLRNCEFVTNLFWNA